MLALSVVLAVTGCGVNVGETPQMGAALASFEQATERAAAARASAAARAPAEDRGAAPEEQLRSIVAARLNGATSWDPSRPRLKAVQVLPAAGKERGYVLTVKFRADDAQRRQELLAEVRKTMRSVYAALFQAELASADGKPVAIRRVIQQAYLPGEGSDGGERPVYTTTLDAAAAAVIDWRDPDGTDLTRYWEVLLVDPHLR